MDIQSFLTGGVAAIVLSGFFRTMPKPGSLGNNIWYKWFYDFAQYLLANADLSGIKLFRGNGNGTKPA